MGTDGATLADPVTESVTFTAEGYYDEVTKNLVNLNADGSIKDQNGKLTWSYKDSNNKEDQTSSYSFNSIDAKPSL